MATKKKDTSSSSSDSGVRDVNVAASRTPWWNVSGWKLRSKIALALAFPMIAASWFAVDKSVEEWKVQQDVKATAGQIRVLEPTLQYLYAAETATVIARSETDSESPARKEAVEAVRTAAEKLESQLDDPNLTANQKAQLSGLVALSDQLRDGRAYVTLLQSRSQVRQLHNGVSDFYQTIINGQNAPEPVLQQISYVMEGRLAFTIQQLQVAYSGNKITNPAEVFSALGIEDAAISQLSRARNDAPTVLDLRSLNAARFDTVESGQGELTYEDALALYDELTVTVLDESVTALDAGADTARSKAVTNIIILMASLAITLLLAWLIARLLLGPVRRLRDGAREVASTKLPEAVATIRAGGTPGAIQPIPVYTNEEVGQLARAVDELHQTAVDLAQGEATLRSQVGEMFVTLSRRNTSLINQQLGLIEELERDEQDPRRLESLFRLDHLAARMRRTAESLVILSDAPVRQREAQSLSVNDALQAATAGVQEYQRVEMRGASADQIVGSAANDVVHLLTELIDNALSFSPPTEPVSVNTTVGSGQTVISISDGGLGLPDDVLDQLNRMLGADVGITPDAARRMGLFVVSRLAQRHGIDVKLAKNGRGGVTASVGLSDHLLVGGASTPAALNTNPAPVVEAPAAKQPVIEQQPVEAPTPVFDNDPLTGPLAPEPVEEPAQDPQVEQINAAISAVTSLPKRRPGATVPGRESAVSPLGGSLFAAPGAPAEAPAEVAEPVSMFGRSTTTDSDEAKSEGKADSGALGIFSRRDALTAPNEELAPSSEQGENPSSEVDDVEDESDESAEAISSEVVARAELEPETAELLVEDHAGPEISAADPLGLDLPRRSAPAVAVIEPEVVEPQVIEPEVIEPEVTEPEPEPEPEPTAPEVTVHEVTEPAPAAPVAAEPEPAAAAPVAAAPQLPTRAPAGAAEDSSNWLSKDAPTAWGESSSDAGWQAAHRASETETVKTTNTGLPQRQPGRRLVPGAVAPTRTAPPRDPEAIRKRLAAHAAGVSRGRTATATTTNKDKEGPA